MSFAKQITPMKEQSMQLQTQTVQTMSTREIADLLGKTHSNIKISAERMQATGVIRTLAVQEFEHNGNRYTEYLLEKRDSLILVAQNSPEYTARIVDRWQELEAQQAPKLPQTMAQALRLAAEQAEQIEHQQAALALAAPKVEFVERYVQPSTGSMGLRQVCKVLGAKQTEFTDFLLQRGLMYRTTPVSPLTPRAEHVHNGRFEAKTGTAEHGDSSHAYVHYKFTAKGVAWIAGLWGQHQVKLALA